MAREHDREAEKWSSSWTCGPFQGYEAYYRRAQEQYGLRYVRAACWPLRRTRKAAISWCHIFKPRPVGAWESSSRASSSTWWCSPSAWRLRPRCASWAAASASSWTTTVFATPLIQPLQTSRPGIYAVGPFREPKDIPETVVEASGAAALAGGLLAAARGTLITPLSYPPERDVSAEEPRIGVFVCHCGSNIGGFLDVPEVVEYASRLPHVAHAEHNLYTCSQDSIRRITEKVQELGLNRVVVASCTPLTHEPLFQDSIRQAGLNPYLFEMANIRNQCSWVHSHDRQAATAKAKQLVQMSVARVAGLEPLHQIEVPVTRRALVIGGGVAGMQVALALAGQDIAVDIIERDGVLGGSLRQVHFLVESRRGRGNDKAQLVWRDPQAYLRDLITQVNSEPRITVHLKTELHDATGYRGNFTSTVRGPDGVVTIQHGATIVATGTQEYRGPEYGYGSDPRILTQQQFEAVLAGEADQLPGREAINSVVMIQCVGPAEKYLQPHLLYGGFEERSEAQRAQPGGAGHNALPRHPYLRFQRAPVHRSAPGGSAVRAL